jgi:hypothetical protein
MSIGSNGHYQPRMDGDGSSDEPAVGIGAPERVSGADGDEDDDLARWLADWRRTVVGLRTSGLLMREFTELARQIRRSESNQDLSRSAASLEDLFDHVSRIPVQPGPVQPDGRAGARDETADHGARSPGRADHSDAAGESSTLSLLAAGLVVLVVAAISLFSNVGVLANFRWPDLVGTGASSVIILLALRYIGSASRSSPWRQRRT